MIRRFRAALAASALGLCGAGCDNNHYGSPTRETKYIEAQVIPEIARWYESPSDSLKLVDMQLPSYDEVCIVAEEWPLRSIEHPVNRDIQRYYSSFGSHAPENFFAVVFVRGAVAHAALIDIRVTRVGASSAKEMCAPFARSLLLRDKYRDPNRSKDMGEDWSYLGVE